MDKKILIIIIFGIILAMPLISSQPYKKGTLIDLKIPFTVNGSAASSTATCNVSIHYPNSSYLAKNESMTNMNNGEFNYTIPTTKSNNIGEHEWIAFCCDATMCAAGYGDFEITPTGYKMETSEGILYIFFLVMVLFIFMLTLYGAAKIPWENKRDDSGKIISVNDLKWVKLACMVFVYLEMIFITTITYELTAGYLYLGGVSGFFFVVHRVLITGLFPLGVIVPWLILILVIADKKTKKMIRRGLPMR